MSWFIDNATSIYLLLAVIAASFVVVWWFNQRVKFLVFAAGTLAILALLWLLTLFVMTDRKHLKANVDAMAQAVQDGKVDDLFKHISKDFERKGLTHNTLYEATRQTIAVHKVSEVRITNFNIEKLSRETKSATTRFRVTAWTAGNDQPQPVITEADFVLEGDQWKLKTMRFYNPFVDQDKEIDLPGLP